jgi:hypothetical protein
LTIGMDGPALVPGALSTIGLPLDDWNESQGLNEANAENGAVFFMDPVSELSAAICCAADANQSVGGANT